MRFGCEDPAATATYLIEEMGKSAGLVRLMGDNNITHVMVLGSEIQGFQFWERNHEFDEIHDQRIKLDRRRMKHEARELDRLDQNESWRG